MAVAVRVGLLLMLVYIIVPSQLAASGNANKNMYTNTATAHGGTTWGMYCNADGGYLPVCGWNLMVSVSYTVSRVEVWQSTAVKMDDYTYQLNPNPGYHDVSARSSECFNINIYGSFGGTQPEIVITYSCVCMDTNSGCVAVPYTLVTPWDYVPTTIPAVITTQEVTNSEVTTQEVTTPEVTTVAVSSNIWGITTKDPVMTHSNTNVSSIKLTHIKNFCYTGGSLKHLSSSVAHLSDCGSFCLVDQDCQAINFHPQERGCSTIHATVDEQDGDDLDDVTGCQLWKVLWKT